MTRDEALLKLIALEPIRRDEIARVTGWPPEETSATLERLRAAGKVTHINQHQHQWVMAGRARSVAC
jgi:predicted Rossmann fold nucleotide-binding protein DprA/Smf involved in DNA uptake